MPTKPENNFIRLVHSKFGDTKPYFEKMYNPLRSGTPDVYYSGDKDCMWVEYKYMQKIPKSTAIVPKLTQRQKHWLCCRFNEGRKVAVVVGSPAGGVVLADLKWLTPVSSEDFMKTLKSPEQIAEWIKWQVGVSHYASTNHQNTINNDESN